MPKPTATILIIDDETSIRVTLQEILSRDGHQVITAESGQAAVELILEHEFDLALIDLKLGDMDGTEVLARLRKQWPDTVAIMLTAHASLETAVAALRQGAQDYLFKPCPTIELRESIRRGLKKRWQAKRERTLLEQLEQHLSTKLADIRTVLGDQESASPTSCLERETQPLPPLDEPPVEPDRFLQYKGLIVDLLQHVATLDGHRLELSPTEFDLLAYLISQAPRVIAPQELVREVQGYDSEQWEASETMRSHIYHIRQKIRQATHRTDIIRTVRGVGYTIG
jgi:DNA-binding response OmpR family regulator